jgi:hypothetical protein
MRGRAEKALQPEALAGRGEAALAAWPGSGWAGHDDSEAIQTCAARAVGVLQASMAAEQEELRVAGRRCACCR